MKRVVPSSTIGNCLLLCNHPISREDPSKVLCALNKKLYAKGKEKTMSSLTPENHLKSKKKWKPLKGHIF